MKHFTIAELCKTSRVGIDNTPPSGVVIALTALVEKVLDPAREAFGAPIRVSSGYRCLALNKAVGGVPSSQHLRGEAADLNTGSREANKRLYEILLAGGQFDQLINEHDYSWVHVSYRRPPATNRRQAFKLGVVALLLALLMGCSKVSAQPRPDRDSIFAAASTEATRYALDRTTAERNQAADISTINQIITTLQNESSKIDLYNSRHPVYRFGCYARLLRQSQLPASNEGRAGDRHHHAHRPRQLRTARTICVRLARAGLRSRTD